jgi:putative colanic acid biosynthesis glycosyltransferase WcaI
LTQGLEMLVDIAAELSDLDNLVVLIVGDGAGRSRLEGAIEQSSLGNIRLLPFQPYHRVPQTYGTADVCLSPMLFGFSYDTVPSKIYTAMAAARPVISACEPDTESAQLLTESNGGLVVTPQSISEMSAAVRKLYESPELKERMGQNARQWIVAHYSKDAVINTYDCVIRDAAATA